MPFVHHARKELHLKVVYYGPGLGGKTTNLEYIHRHSRPENRGKLISLNTEAERTLFFDLLPVELGKFKGYTVRLHLCTVPGQIAHDRTRQLVLRNVDGIVFVVDSQRVRIEDNLESIRNLETNLLRQGDDPTRLPLIVQYNKRDLPDIASVDELHKELNVPEGVMELEAVATEGIAVFETLKDAVKSCLTIVGNPSTAREGRSPSILPGRRASMFPGGLPPALAEVARDQSRVEVHVPRAPRVPKIAMHGGPEPDSMDERTRRRSGDDD